MKILISKDATQTKPTDYRPYQTVYAYNSYEFDTCDDMAELIGSGHAWRAFNYVEGAERVIKANTTATYIIGMDIDETDATPEQVCEYALSIGLPVNFYYYTYSQGKKPKNNFRVVWCFKESMDMKHYETMYKMLLNLFEQFGPDKATKDASRLFNGTDKGAVVIKSELSTLKELGWLGVCEKVKNNISTSNMRKTTKTLCNKYFSDDDDACAPAEVVTIGVDWYEQLRGNCDLWTWWEKGKYLDYNQRLTLFTNLKYLKYSDTGRTVLQDVIDIFYEHEDTYTNHTCDEAQIRQIFGSRSLTPLPVMRDAFGHHVTIPQFFQGGLPQKIVNNIEEKVELEQLDAELNEEIPELLSSQDNIYIECQTASGKTHRIINWMLHQDLNNVRIIYSVPRYNLISEFVDRFKYAYHMDSACFGDSDDMTYPIYTISERTYTDADLNRLYIGLPADNTDAARSSDIKQFFNGDWHGVYVITHELLSRLTEIKASIIIVDEDITETLIRYITYDLDALTVLGNYTPKKDIINKIVESAQHKQTGECIDISGLSDVICDETLNLDDYLECKMPKVKNLFDCTKLTRDAHIGETAFGKQKTIRFTLKSDLINAAVENNVPIKLFSATPKDALLKAYYNSFDFKKVKFERAKNKGEIIQYVGCTGAKGSKDNIKIDRLIEYIKKSLPKKVIDDAYCLTFKDYTDYFEQKGFNIPYTPDGKVIHLGNNSGLDILKGKNVIVAGKFDYPDSWYFDVFYDFNDATAEKPHRENTKQIINGNAQKLYLWTDETLQQIQLDNIRQILEQSTGRARALRESGANVYVFADLKIADADKYIK